MRYNLLTLCMVLAGLLLLPYRANAGVITSLNSPTGKHDRSHKAIIYQNLSHNPAHKKFITSRNLINSSYSDKYLLSGNNGFFTRYSGPNRRQLTGFLSANANLGTGYTSNLAWQNNPIAAENLNGNAPDIVIDSFLDNLKNNPSFRTVYFTSKDLIFSYREKGANLLQLGFNMAPNDYRNYRGHWKNYPDDVEIALTGNEKNNFQQQASILLGLISKSYKNIFYILLALSGGLYICFRYFLNKYI